MASNTLQKRVAKTKGFVRYASSLFLLRYSPLNASILKNEITRLNVNRLHVGCGHVKLPGWLNIAFEKREEYGRLIRDNGTLYLNYNLLKDWPIADSSIEYIAASHFIEHFDLNAGMNFTKRCFRVLKPKGIIRLSCPNLELYAKNYVERNNRFFSDPLIREWCTFKNAETFGEIFIAKAYDSGGTHKWFYDFESLRHILESAGFKEIERKGRLEGKTPDLDRIELAQRELETVYVEAVKP